MADNLIDQQHSDAVTIAGWKDSINEKWADVQELIETRVLVIILPEICFITLFIYMGRSS